MATSEQAPADAPADPEADLELALFLAELIDLHERTAWRDVPGVSAAEAAAWTQRLIEARDELERRDGE